MNITKIQQHADGYLVQGQYVEAITLYEQCIDANPNLVSGYWHLGLARLLQGEESEAQAIWLSVMAQGTLEEVDIWMAELSGILQAEAVRHLSLGKLQLAERICWQVLELDPNRVEAHYSLGNALAQQGDLDEAIACWQRAVNLQPDFAEAYQDQGYVFQKLEEFDQAIACYSKALECQPDWLEAHYNLGLCFSQQNRLDEAITCFKNAIEIKPDYTQSYGDLGNALLRKGNLNEAITCFKNAIRIKPHSAQFYCKQVETLERKDFSEQRDIGACLLKSLLLQESSAEALLCLGQLLAKQKDFDRAVSVYQEVIKIQPESAKAYFELGKSLFEQKDFDWAINAYQKAIKIQPELVEAYFELGRSLSEINSFNRAIASYKKALTISPSLSEVFCYLGKALSAIGKWDEAVTCYKKMLGLEADSASAYCYLGVALAQQNKADEALACFQKVMKINPDTAEEIFDIITILRQNEVLNEKVRDFQQALPIDPPTEFYESTCDWANTSLEKANYISIYPKNIVYLTPPKTLDKTICFSFRFGSYVELPATFVAIVTGGRHWSSKGQTKSATITPDNKLLADLSPEFPALSPGHPDKHPSKHSIFSLKKLPPIQKIDGTVAVLAGLSNNVYFHWMCDTLPRIELLRYSGIELAKIDFFLIASRLPFQKETLQALSISEDKILEVDNYSHIKAARLVVPSFPSSIAWMPRWACEFLRDTFLSQTIEISNKIERLYISRKDAENRRITNEEEVVSSLEYFGFKSVTLEGMSVAGQAALLANAKVVVAPHGGGLTNIMFCQPGTKVIEIFSPNYVYPCYWLISNIANLEYYYLLGETPEGFYLHQLLNQNPRLEDIYVNLDELLNLMKFAGVL